MIIQKHAKVLTYGNEKAENLLLVLHGYGQLVDYFLPKFHSLQQQYFIVAPEATHRFYLNGFSGRVGASWMTKEQRQWDIHDNLQYLNQVLQTYANGRKINLLGFSQGGSTAARLLCLGDFYIHKFVLWASVFPKELLHNPKLEKTKKYFVLGKKDAFFSEQQQQEALDFHAQHGFENHVFEGEHNIDTNSLQRLFIF